MPKLAATVEKVLCCRENGKRFWHFLKTQHGIMSGVAAWEIKDGERIVVNGTWGVFRGEKQFKFDAATPDIPDNQRAMLYYVCSLAHGFAEATADKIWNKLGDNWRNLKGGDIPGITDAKVKSFREAIEYVTVHSEMAKTVSYFMNNGCTQLIAEKAWDEWKNEARGILESNCYRLTELPRVSFAIVDRSVRQFYAIGDSDQRRIESGILYSITKLSELGNTIFDWSAVCLDSCKLLSLSAEVVAKAAKQMIADGKVIPYPKTRRLTIPLYDNAEQTIFAWVKQNVA
jgi:hypothetical protein